MSKINEKKGYTNMLCEKCKKNEAQVHYTENINGKETSMSLCHECASKMQLTGGLGLRRRCTTVQGPYLASTSTGGVGLG